MIGKISIRPSKDLRNNYAQISSLSRKNPVAITVNGKEDTVVLCHDYFMEQQEYISELEAKLAVYAHLAQAADDVKLGRVQQADAAFDDVLAELDGLKDEKTKTVNVMAIFNAKKDYTRVMGKHT